ncbi:MAG: FixH family protein [Planctomycetes bacterium]|nr:FixH family protein [Planctomycetota bacterium]
MNVFAATPLVRFESPGYLVLLAVLPLVVALSIRSLSGLGPIRRWLSIAFRCAVITAMTLALAGAQRTQTTDALSVIFLLDRSASIPKKQQQQGFDFIGQAKDGLRVTKDRIGVVAFDGESAVEQLPMGALGITRVGDPVRPEQTNVEDALSMSMALFTADAARRVVLLSDGNENLGHALAEADQFKAAGVPIDVVPLRYSHADEIVFERLSSPPTATAEETIDLQMVLRSTKPTDGVIQLYHNDKLEQTLPASLETGANRFKIPVPMRIAGAHRFRAVFQPKSTSSDTLPANNEARAFTVVSGQGRILILTQESEDGVDVQSAEILAKALESEKLVCDVEVVGAKPLDQVRLLEYSLVILSNVPAYTVPDEARKALAAYVRDLGGGLIMVGGGDSFGAGGWMDTPVEEVMPVTFDIKSKKQIPKGALVLVMHACEIPQGNYWGERVAIASVKTLSSRDLIGVLSFQWRSAEQKYWDVPLQEVRDKAAIISKIKAMQMGDMPDLDAVMRPGVEELIKRRDAAAKHMIVISDFDPAEPQSDLIDKMKKYGITCSTVAIGWGGHNIDVGKARRIADNTGGKYYTTQDYRELPQIFMKESRVVRRSLVQETEFVPQLTGVPSTLVQGLKGDAVPPLRGYVLTTAKPLAQIPMVRPTDDGQDPILAHWQVGLGKTVAFTSGLWPRWGADWAEWPKFSKLWAQIARWASRQAAAAALDVSTSVQGGKARIRIDALDKDAAALNFMNIEGMLVDPRSDSKALRLTQTGPGRYEAEFDAQTPGSYVVNLAYQTGRGENAVSGTLQTGVSVAYSPEYRELKTNEAMLRELADRTGGQVLDPANAKAAFDLGSLPRAESRRSIWEDLVRWTLLLFLLDVAVRRIAVNPIELLRKLRRRIAELAGAPPTEASAAVLSTLKGTRDRAREELAKPAPTETGPAPSRSARYEAPVSDSKVTEQLSQALGGASEVDQPVVAKPTRKAAPTSEADFTSRLLKAKKQARDKLDSDDQGEPPAK